SFRSHAVLALLPSFPTRRSSDLIALVFAVLGVALGVAARAAFRKRDVIGVLLRVSMGLVFLLLAALLGTITIGEQQEDEAHGDRSEEHTSELQSRGHLVCRLLLV